MSQIMTTSNLLVPAISILIQLVALWISLQILRTARRMLSITLDQTERSTNQDQ
jgi:hypothetical protein